MMEQTVENFHGCYLLRSENPYFKGRTYIGYTVDPNRRQKQHNGGRKFGGAVRTASKGPWTVIVIVYGFMTNIAALQFEWAWQHPDESRRLKQVTKKASRETALAFRLRIMAEMLCVDPWRRLPLTVQWMRTDCQIEFPVRLQLPDHMFVLNGTMKAKKVAKALTDEEPEVLLVQDAPKDHQEAPASARCRLCLEMIQGGPRSLFEFYNRQHRILLVFERRLLQESAVAEMPGLVLKPETRESHTLSCVITACAAKFHITCLAEEFLKAEPGSLVPLKGTCPVCESNLLWADLIRFKKGFYRDCVVQAEGIKNLADLSGDEED